MYTNVTPPIHFTVVQFFANRYSTEELVLRLMKVKYLPVLLYGIEAWPVNLTHMRSFEFTVKRHG